MKLRILAARLLRRKPVRQVCEACGCEFACAASLDSCWCTEIQLSETARARLRERYRHCLCRDCLERAAAKSAT